MDDTEDNQIYEIDQEYKIVLSISNFKGSFARKNFHKLDLKENNLVELYKLFSFIK